MPHTYSTIAFVIQEIAEDSQRESERFRPTAQEFLDHSKWDDWIVKVYFKRSHPEKPDTEQYGVTFMARGRKGKMEELFDRFKSVCDPQGEIWIELSTALGPIHGCRGNIKMIRKTLGRLVPLEMPGPDGWRDDLEMVPFTAKRARFGRG